MRGPTPGTPSMHWRRRCRSAGKCSSRRAKGAPPAPKVSRVQATQQACPCSRSLICAFSSTPEGRPPHYRENDGCPYQRPRSGFAHAGKNPHQRREQETSENVKQDTFCVCQQLGPTRQLFPHRQISFLWRVGFDSSAIRGMCASAARDRARTGFKAYRRHATQRKPQPPMVLDKPLDKRKRVLPRFPIII